MDYHNVHQNGRAHIIRYSSNIQGGTANLLSIRPSPWKHPIWTPLVDTHIIHKPSHHQERPPHLSGWPRSLQRLAIKKRHGGIHRFAPFSQPSHPPQKRKPYHCRSSRSPPEHSPIAPVETGSRIRFAWTLWASILDGTHESPFRTSIMTGYFDRKKDMPILIGHCA